MRTKKTHQEFVDEVKIKAQNINVLGKYSGSNSKVQVECKKCGNVWDVIANSILHGSGCPKCKKIYNKISHEEFVIKLAKKNDSIELLSNYHGAKGKVKCRCKKCNNIWNITPNALMQGRGCNRCKAVRIGNLKRYTNEQFLEKINIVNSNIEILSTYTDSHSKVKCRCKSCNHIWYVRPNHLLQGHGCPICKESSGEKKICQYLKEKKIKFERQKKFDDLVGVNNGLLSYDFYLPNQKLLIEYQGEFHDGSVKGGIQTKREYETQQEHDNRKREYAKQNNMGIVEIWYHDFYNIANILDRIIKTDLERCEQ